jgi:hypothetical protein
VVEVLTDFVPVIDDLSHLLVTEIDYDIDDFLHLGKVPVNLEAEIDAHKQHNSNKYTVVYHLTAFDFGEALLKSQVQLLLG